MAGYNEDLASLPLFDDDGEVVEAAVKKWAPATRIPTSPQTPATANGGLVEPPAAGMSPTAIPGLVASRAGTASRPGSGPVSGGLQVSGPATSGGLPIRPVGRSGAGGPVGSPAGAGPAAGLGSAGGSGGFAGGPGARTAGSAGGSAGGLAPTATPGGGTRRPIGSLIGDPAYRSSESALVPAAAAMTPAASRQDDIDWSQVNTYRVHASEQLTAAIKARGGGLDPVAERELGRSIIHDILATAAQDNVALGLPVPTAEEQHRMAVAVFDAVFGLGRLQPLVDDDAVENILINGYDNVILEAADGTQYPGPPVADSDTELLEFLTFLASRSEVNARPFSEAQPRLHLRLDGGARLAATAWVTPRPVVAIRRHRLRVVTLEDLAERSMMTNLAASFLRAAVRAKKSIVVSGPQGAGKTTMVRALCSELEPGERIGTFETEYELHLHELPGRDDSVIAWEARPGSGERLPDGKLAGEITIDDCLYDSFRFNLSRQIVGEVRGREVLAMFKAMESSGGSISTTHATSAKGAIDKLITCALEAGPQVSESFAKRAVAEHIDLIVQVSMLNQYQSDGSVQRFRFVSEIAAVEPGEFGPALTHIFRMSDSGFAEPAILPDPYRYLSNYGFDIDEFHRRGVR